VPESLFDRSRYEGRFEDEQRLLYVALSRARELLVVTWFEHRAAREAPASRFLVRQLKTELRNAGRLGSCSPVAVSNPRHDEEPLETEFSRLSLYSECGYRYWLRCICGFRTRRVPELGFGKLLHHLLAELARVARDRGVVSPSDVDRLLDERFYLPFAGAVPRAKLREAAARRLRRYVRDYGVELFRVIEPERRFEVPLEHARVKGRIDLLLRAPGGNERDVVLVDFKTAENRPPSESHQNQLRLYAKACERLGYRPVELLIHDLDADDGERMVVPWDERAAARFMDDLATWVDGIRSCRFEPVAEQATCARCDFRDFCRFAPPRDRPAGSAGPHRKESGR
jgi:DNA helicase-2/ATP-dependent DNA helicase PcrA